MLFTKRATYAASQFMNTGEKALILENVGNWKKSDRLCVAMRPKANKEVTRDKYIYTVSSQINWNKNWGNQEQW